MTQPPPYTKMPSTEVRENCRSLLLWKAQKYNVPPALIVAHCRQVAVVAARREVMAQMLAWGLTRSQLALAFGRDLRRVRASVIRKKRKKKLPALWNDYARFDLFGRPLQAGGRRQARVDCARIRASVRSDVCQLPLPFWVARQFTR